MSRLDKKHILTVSDKYILNWSINDAIREFIQNMIDQEKDNPKNKGSVLVENNIMYICNKTSVLEKGSLILGETTKRDSKDSIGQFGEGYKLALLVLLREGVEVIIHNYGAKENWYPKLEYFKQYEANLLTINIDSYWFSKPPNSNLIFEIKGLENPRKILKEVMLQNKKYKGVMTTEKGEILIPKKDKDKGNIYVNRLFVTKIEDLEYSYNFCPELVNIGRDRNLLNSFDVTWSAAKLWTDEKVQMNYEDEIKDGIHRGIKDFENLQYQTSAVSKKVKEDLVQDLGGAYPVTSEEEKKSAIDMFGSSVKTKIVSDTYLSTIKDSIVEPTIKEEKKASYPLERFFKKHKKQFTREMKKDFEALKKELFPDEY